jgi:hypothetical protein
MRLRRLVGPVVTLLLASCTTAGSAGPSTTDPAPTTTHAVPNQAVQHRIGVRVVDGAGEMYDRVTGERFVARGVNLIRLAGGAHSTLNVGHYDPDRIEAAFAEIASHGFNVVRVFLNSRPGGLPGMGESLSSPYLDNVVDLLARARAHGLQVLLTQDWLPESADWAFASDPMIEDVNSMYLSRGGLVTNQRFYEEFVAGLVERGAAFDALLGYELRNELYFTELHPPFSLDSGTVTTANGASYDLADPDAHVRLLEDNLVFWADAMRATILELDPTALVTVGFFQPKGPNTSRVGDDRLIETRRFIVESNMDFIDLHGYPGGELDLGQIVENYGLPAVTEKPVLLGEFGAEHGPYPGIDHAVGVLVDWQVESCAHGFDGWMVWTWDTAEQPEFWTAVDEDMAIAGALSPSVRPDPCSTGDLSLSLELAQGAGVEVSTATEEDPGANAVDGLADTVWNSGSPALQWIVVDLGAERVVESIQLLVAQDPAGPTTHVVSVRGDPGDWVELPALTGETSDGQWIEVPLPEPLSGVRFVGVETRESPSFVAWREISIRGR